MAERRDGDWDCPDCGAVCFASKESCFKCDKKAGGGGATRRDGDWDCPVCGSLCFASKETCFNCDRGGGKAKGKGKGKGKTPDWNCSSCGEMVFGSKDACFKCGTAKGDGDGAAAPKKKSAVGSDAPGDTVKAIVKMSPKFKKSWVTYCKTYGTGTSDPSKYDKDFITEFFDYASGLIAADLEGGAGEEVAEKAPVARTKRAAPAAAEADDAPPAKVAKPGLEAEKKKVTMRKSVADEIRRLNGLGIFEKEIRPGAVVGPLAKLEEAAALELLEELESAEEMPDPNKYIQEEAKARSD